MPIGDFAELDAHNSTADGVARLWGRNGAGTAIRPTGGTGGVLTIVPHHSNST